VHFGGAGACQLGEILFEIVPWIHVSQIRNQTNGE
jgi:hypothetical protein